VAAGIASAEIGLAAGDDPRLLVNHGHVGTRKRRGASRIEVGADMILEELGIPRIVGVEEGDEDRFAGVEPGQHGLHLAPIAVLAHEAEAIVVYPGQARLDAPG